MHDDAVVAPPYLAPPFRLAPFRALRLAPSRVGDPASARAFARPYHAVGRRLREWQRRGSVERDPRPAVHLHEYTAGGLTVRGLVGGLDLTRRTADVAESTVLPHEGIHVAQAAELSGRMLEMELNPAPILLVHRGGGAAARVLADLLHEDPDHEYDDRAGQHHRLWAVHDPAHLEQLDAVLAGTRALIADGHHRYAAYLDLQRRRPGTGWDRGLAMLVDQDDTPLHLGAIHRVLDGIGVDEVAGAAERLGGTATPAPWADALAQLGHQRLVVGDGVGWRVLALPVPEGDLAVCAFHRLLEDLSPDRPDVGLHHTAQDVLDAVGRSPGSTAVLLPAADLDTVLELSRHGTLLPEKATSFQPKPDVGVLMRSPRDD